MKPSLGLLAVILAMPAAYAHPNHDDPSSEPQSLQRPAPRKGYGHPGSSANVASSISIDMDASGRCTPNALTVRKGQTVRIVARNSAPTAQDLAIGTPVELREHAEVMRKFPQMQTAAVQRLRIAPEKIGELVWQFPETGEFSLSCAGPGRFDAASLAKIIVKP